MPVLDGLKSRIDAAILVKDREKKSLLAYLEFKEINEDWHGIADAAMDLRDLQHEVQAYRQVLKWMDQENE